MYGHEPPNTRDSVSSRYPNTEKRVENTTRSGVSLTKFEALDISSKCLIYLLKRNKIYEVNDKINRKNLC